MGLRHEVKPVQHFTTYKEEHRSNACCEIPPSIVVRAIQSACQIPYDSEAEDHPAMKILAQWWNENAPNEENRCAGHAKVWVRVEDNHVYWSSCYEEPERSVIYGITDPSAVARCGDFLLLEFAKSRSTVYEDNGLVCEDVSGEIFESVAFGISLEEYDSAGFGLVGLEQFPERFPVAWQALNKAYKATTNKS